LVREREKTGKKFKISTKSLGFYRMNRFLIEKFEMDNAVH
jgi:hypothetical protein